MHAGFLAVFDGDGRYGEQQGGGNGGVAGSGERGAKLYRISNMIGQPVGDGDGQDDDQGGRKAPQPVGGGSWVRGQAQGHGQAGEGAGQ